MTALKRLLTTAAFGTVMATASLANAALITEWTFSAQNSWNYSATTFGGGSPFTTTYKKHHQNESRLPNNTDPGQSVSGASGRYNAISWGPSSESSRSFLGADTSFNQSSLVTDGDKARGASFYHNNASISTNYASLLQTQLTTSIVITPKLPEPGASIPLQMDLTINFNETDNGVSRLSNCSGYARWSQGISTSGVGACPDVFSINTSSLSLQKEIDDYLYTFTINFEPGSGVLNVTQNNGQTEIWTRENYMSTLTSWITVTSQYIGLPIENPEDPTDPTPVSEPGTIGLLGLGLAAAGAGMRRRRRK